MDDEVTRDALLGGAVTLLQPRRGHRAGTDAVLLAVCAQVQDGDDVVDLGAASGAVGLMIAHRMAGARITLLEREPALVALCRDNIALNGLSERANAIEADIFAPPEQWKQAGLVPGRADLVATNPPYAGEGARASPDPGRRAAHVMRGGDLAGWLDAAATLLRPRGRLCVIHRADQLAGCLSALAPSFGSVTVIPVHPRADQAATRILLRAVKGGRAPLTLSTAIVLHGADGEFTPSVAALHGR